MVDCILGKDLVLIAFYMRASLAPVQKLHISIGKTNAVPP